MPVDYCQNLILSILCQCVRHIKQSGSCFFKLYYVAQKYLNALPPLGTFTKNLRHPASAYRYVVRPLVYLGLFIVKAYAQQAILTFSLDMVS